MKNFIESTIYQAGQAALQRFDASVETLAKSRSSDLVTEADLVSESIIIDAIQTHFPDHSVLSEESGRLDRKGEWTWIVDPLDGTRNYSRHVPFWGILMGASFNGQLQYGAMYFPALDELYLAQRGQGIVKNGRQLDVSRNTLLGLEDSVGCLSLDPRKTSEIQFLQTVSRELPDSSLWLTALNCNSLAAAMVIDGRRDWCIASYAGQPWDYVVPVFLMQEAGLVVTNWQGQSWQSNDTSYIVAPSAIHSDLLRLTT